MSKNAKDFQLLQRTEFFIDQCRGKKVLHLGCTNYPYTEHSIANDMLLHFELEKIASEIYGLDYDQDGIDILKRRGSKNIFQADLEKLDELTLSETFDVIVAGDIIEHLNNPGLFLNGIQRFMDNKTLLILTTINAYCGLRFLLYGLRGKRGRIEPVHPDHVAYYSYSTLSLLLKRHNLVIENFYFYDIGLEHRPHNRKILNFLNDVCVRVAPQWADGLIAVCKLPSKRNKEN